MFEMNTTNSHSHVGSQALSEVFRCFVGVFLWQLFPNDLQGDFQLISHLRLLLEFMVLFQYGASDVIVQKV